MPFHIGAIDHFKEIGAWTVTAEAHNNRLIERQDVLQAAWTELKLLDLNEDEFSALWPSLRAKRLADAGFDPVWR